MGFDSQAVKASKMVQWIKRLSWVFNSQFMHFQLIKWICARIEPFRETIAIIKNPAVFFFFGFDLIGTNRMSVIE